MKNKEIKIPYVDDVEIPAERENDISNRGVTLMGSAGSFRGGRKRLISAMQTYDAIVDVNGHGDYTNIQAALNAGKKRIFVRGGTYTLTADITLDNDVLIQGESKYNTIIDLNGDHQIKAVGDTPYTTGTIAVTNGSATIIGDGTAWLSNLAVNDFIVFNGNVYKIISIDSDTSLTIDIQYEGKSESGISYKAGTFKNNIYLRDLTVKEEIYFYGMVNSGIDNCIITKNNLGISIGIHLYFAYNIFISNVAANNGANYGIKIESSNGIFLLNVNVNNNEQFGILLDDTSNVSLSNIIANNNGYGISLDTSYNISLSNITANNNKNYNVIIHNSSYNISLSNIIANNSGGYSIFLESSNNASFLNIIANNNENSGIYLYSTYNNSFSNIIANNNKKNGIYLDGDVDNNSFSSIIANNNENSGIYLHGAHNNFFSNININNNKYYGIIIEASSYNTIQGILKNNCQIANNSYPEIKIVNIFTAFSQNNIINVDIYENATNRANYGIYEERPSAWTASTAYSYGDHITPTTGNGYIYECTVAGTSGTAEPTWPTTVGDTVTDGSVTWECIRGNDYNLIHGCIIQGPATGAISLYGAGSVAADNITI